MAARNPALAASPGYRHCIIGGTIKGATSSLFNYLGAHPQVCASRIKETFFFSRNYSGDETRDHSRYLDYFAPRAGHRVLLEASPNYLAFKQNLAPRIRQLIPDARLLFVLRNPVDRLYSHFHFARGKLELPPDLDFEEFTRVCEAFSRGEMSPEQAGIAEKHLRALEIGNYGHHLRNFYELFDRESIKLVFYDDFNLDPLACLVEISDFIGIDPAFFENHELRRANVTFYARHKYLHSIALWFNQRLEPFLRRHPRSKHALVSLYKFFNRSRRDFTPMSRQVRQKLEQYYAPSNRILAEILQARRGPAWLESPTE